MPASPLQKLVAIARTLDDEALASLANKGLVRRAQKDLESSRPALVSADADRVQFQIGDAIVEIVEPLGRSRCSCPAAGICRHILVALVFLRDDPAVRNADFAAQQSLFDVGGDRPSDTDQSSAGAATSAPPEPLAVASPEEILGGVTDKELQAWAGKAAFKKATLALADNPPVEIEAGATLVIRFPTRNINCRWIPSDNLLSLVCSCQSETPCEHAVAAVLAYQVSLGRRTIQPTEKALKESAGAPRTRAEVLASTLAMLREIVSLGLARLSAATVQRVTTLAISAHGVDLPRLERMLKALAEEIDLVLRRDAQANSTNLLLSLSRANALASALESKPTSAVIGQHRTQYHEVGQITLVGLGAQHWKSKGGYRGLTVFFWDKSRGDFATWSEARPIQQAGFDPVGRYGADGPWSGCQSPRQASGSVLRLTGAWRNARGRISGRASIQALVVGPTSISEVPEPIVEWSQLRPRAEKLFGGGLTEPPENLDLAIVAPHAWLPAQFDPLRQELIRPIADRAGWMLPLWLPFTPENESAIDVLETHDPAESRAVLVAIRLIAARLYLQPMSLISDDRILSLNLEKTPPTGPAATATAADSPPADELESDEDAAAIDNAVVGAMATTSLGRLLIGAQAELEAIAESGIAAHRDNDRLRAAANRLESIGLVACARPLSRLVEMLDRFVNAGAVDDRRAVAARLLQAHYVVHLAGVQEGIGLALAGIG